LTRIDRQQLRVIIKEELETLREASGGPKTTTGFPDELPTVVDKTKALERYRQEMSSLEAQIASATSSAEKSALQGKLQDVTDQHNNIAQGAALA
tara:strand:- start:7660 stop:7944 length:285 start_codon:yes stop_codon:yes gene_type:complete